MRLKTVILSIFFVFGLASAAFFGGNKILLSPSHPEFGGDEGSEIEEKAKQYGVTFPIAELGNCSSYTECRTFCEDPANFDACISFAKTKGFYKDEDEVKIKSILSRARQTLGCETSESCRSFCSQEENFDRCHRFAENSGLAGGYVQNPESGDFLNKAKEVLGCDSYGGCKDFCSNPANRDRCSQFASQIGARGGYEYHGPGGCSSEETCRSFCSQPENIEVCRRYSEGYGGRFVGPGGCTDEASCRSYCERNPQACGGDQGRRDYDPQEVCKKTPSCKWEENSCQCGFYEEVDRNFDPATACTKYPGCSWNGSWCQCQSSQSETERWKSECIKYSGCSWTGSSCQCTGGGENTSPQPFQTPSSGDTYSGDSTWPASTPYGGGYGRYTISREQQESACRAGGGTCQWNGDTCGCQGYSSSGTNTNYSTPYSQPGYDPAAECGRTSGCSWNGSSCQCSGSGGSSDPAAACGSTPGCSWNGFSCQCSSVQGAATVFVKSWGSDLIDYITGLFTR